ncbi:MAG: caspase family protein [Fimbriimonadia bacterium]|jgi:hypothetical protein
MGARRLLTLILVLVLALPAAVSGQEPWVAPYLEGLKAAKEKDWGTARGAFEAAIAIRAEDSGSQVWFKRGPTQRDLWRGGAPYTPNFAAAYCTYRLAVESGDGAVARSHYEDAAKRLAALLSKEQFAPLIYSLLVASYTAMGDEAKKTEVLSDYAQKRAANLLKVRVDTEFVLPEDLAATKKLNGTPQTGSGETTGPKPAVPSDLATAGPVPFNPLKHAILIGNSRYHGSIGDVPNAINDCYLMRDALTKHAGYDPANVVILAEPTYEEMLAGVQQFAAKLPPGAIVFFFYTGAGRVNTADKVDYLIPNGAPNRDAFSSFVRKNDLLYMFVGKAERTIAVFQVDRLQEPNGMCFGDDLPVGGSIAYVRACMTGERCQTKLTASGINGLWASAAAWVLENRMRGPRIAIESFCWEILDRVLSVNTGARAESRQTPLLPNYSLLSQDATF